MLSLCSSPFSLVNAAAPMRMNTRASVVMKGSEIVLADKETEAKIMAVVNAEKASTKSAAMCSQMTAANLDRIRMEEEDGGCNNLARPSPSPPASAGTCL